MPNQGANHHRESTVLDEAVPCSGCRHERSCADLHLACSAYADYHNWVDWSEAAREPQAGIYEALFEAED